MLIEVLGKEFNGVLGCDYFSAYRRYHREFGVTLQFCLAHLIRDVKFLTTLPDAREQAYGTRLREALRALFGVIHRREQLTAKQFQSATRGGAGRSAALCHERRAGDKALSQPGEAVRDARGELFPVHHDAGSGADEQPGGASDPVRGDRPSDHAGDKE